MGAPDKHRLCGGTCGSESPINLPGTPANLPALGTAGARAQAGRGPWVSPVFVNGTEAQLP